MFFIITATIYRHFKIIAYHGFVLQSTINKYKLIISLLHFLFIHLTDHPKPIHWKESYSNADQFEGKIKKNSFTTWFLQNTFYYWHYYTIVKLSMVWQHNWQIYHVFDDNDHMYLVHFTPVLNNLHGIYSLIVLLLLGSLYFIIFTFIFLHNGNNNNMISTRINLNGCNSPKAAKECICPPHSANSDLPSVHHLARGNRLLVDPLMTMSTGIPRLIEVIEWK